MDLEKFSPKVSFEKNVKLMKIMGLQPIERYPGIFKFHAYFLYIIFLLPIPLLTVYNILISEPSKKLQILEDIHIVVEVAAQAIKVLPFKRRPLIMKYKIIDMWSRDIFNTHTKFDVKFLQSTFFEYNVIFTSFAMSVIFSWIALIVQQLVQSTRLLPYNIWMPFDALNNTNVYIFVSVYLHVAILALAFTNMGIDSFIAGLMLQSATQLRLIKNRLQNMDEYAEEDLKNISLGTEDPQRQAVVNKIIYERICKCVDIRDAVALYAKDLEEVFSLSVFIQLFVHVLALSVLILRLGKTDIMSYDFYLSTFLLVPFMVEILLFCYYGTILHNESITIPDAIFMSPWYNYDEKSKKTLLILMENSQKPVKLTAGKILDVSLETFTLVLRRSYSLLAILKNY